MKKLDQSGQLSIDFLFAIVLIVSTAALVSTLCISLTLAEVLQYVTFSGARAYLAADNTKTDQAQAGVAQANSLITSLPFLSNAVKNRWILLAPSQGGPGDYRSYAEGKGLDVSSYEDKVQFVGYQLQVQFSILSFKLPLFGDLVQPPNGQPVKATLSSFMMREPTTQECRALIGQIFNQLKINYSKITQFSGKSGSRTPIFTAIADNGC